MAGLEKKPTSLRQISDLVGKLKKEIKIQFEVADICRNNGYRVSPSWLYVEAGLKLRNLNVEHAEIFKQMWLRGVRIPPFLVKVVIFEGVPHLKIIDGHHRFAGLMQLLLRVPIYNR